jgi:CDP-glycerol glycerophosphotransferase (TagB/SpsB family)
MQPKITYNDAWESIPLDCVDDVIEFFDRELQPAHPLRRFKLFPVAKCWRRYKYLVEEEDSSDLLWVLDMQRKKRIRGKTCYYFKRIETQEELDAMLRADYMAWVQYMKDAGAWHGE